MGGRRRRRGGYQVNTPEHDATTPLVLNAPLKPCCPLGQHPQIAMIDAQMKAGVSIGTIRQQFQGLPNGKGPIWKHRSVCLGIRYEVKPKATSTIAKDYTGTVIKTTSAGGRLILASGNAPNQDASGHAENEPGQRYQLGPRKPIPEEVAVEKVTARVQRLQYRTNRLLQMADRRIRAMLKGESHVDTSDEEDENGSKPKRRHELVNLQSVAALMRELRENLKLEAQLTGELSTGTNIKVVLGSDEYQQHTQAIWAIVAAVCGPDAIGDVQAHYQAWMDSGAQMAPALPAPQPETIDTTGEEVA